MPESSIYLSALDFKASTFLVELQRKLYVVSRWPSMASPWGSVFYHPSDNSKAVGGRLVEDDGKNSAETR